LQFCAHISILATPIVTAITSGKIIYYSFQKESFLDVFF
jgi:hypothetical protein